MNVIQIAAICHTANKELCEIHGDESQPPWLEAPMWQQESAIKGVEFHIANPSADIAASHDAWMKHKLEEGWQYGLVKDIERKEHPCIVLFNQLPERQQRKDALFKAIVHALADPF